MSYTRGADQLYLVGPVGFEPTTSCSQSTRATKLRHGPRGIHGTRFPESVRGDSYRVNMWIAEEIGVPQELQSRVGAWDSLSQWERSEIGRDLRRLGLSYGEIRQLIDVKKSTLATWCRGIDLSEVQKRAILLRTGSRRGDTGEHTAEAAMKQIKQLRKEARTQALTLIENAPWIAGVILYWAEGAKTNRRLEMAHTEPSALILYREWVREFHSPEAQFRASINLHADNDEPQAPSVVGYAPRARSDRGLHEVIHQTRRNRTPKESPAAWNMQAQDEIEHGRLAADS